MVTLSYIIPVYNTEMHLSKCIDSLIQQDIPENFYEIIIINDGSTDNSLQIIKSYLSKYTNIILISQENKGVGDARNSGIRLAKGKYLIFVDSDDFWEPNSIGLLINKMEVENLDILRFNYQNVNSESETIIPYKNYKHNVDFTDRITDGKTFLNERLGYTCYVHQFVFKTQIIKKDENKFTSGIYFEDVEWLPRVLIQSNRITSINKIVYNYLLREGSITQSISLENKKKIVNDKLFIIQILQQQMLGIKDNKWYKGMISDITISILGFVVYNFYHDYSKIISELKTRNVFPLYTYNITWRQKVHYFIANISPKLYGLIKYYIKTYKEYLKIIFSTIS